MWAQECAPMINWSKSNGIKVSWGESRVNNHWEGKVLRNQSHWLVKCRNYRKKWQELRRRWGRRRKKITKSIKGRRTFYLFFSRVAHMPLARQPTFPEPLREVVRIWQQQTHSLGRKWGSGKCCWIVKRHCASECFGNKGVQRPCSVIRMSRRVVESVGALGKWVGEVSAATLGRQRILAEVPNLEFLRAEEKSLELRRGYRKCGLNTRRGGLLLESNRTWRSSGFCFLEWLLVPSWCIQVVGGSLVLRLCSCVPPLT